MQRVGDRRLVRLVVLREWSIEHRTREDPTDSLAVHDERKPGRWVLRIHRRRVVGDIAGPGRPVPLDAGALGVPRLPIEVRGRAVVEDATVEWPAPGPVGVEAHTRRVVLLRVRD